MYRVCINITKFQTFACTCMSFMTNRGIRRLFVWASSVLALFVSIFQGLMEETKEHEEARLFILSTVPFLVEHSHIADREGMTTMAEDFSARHRKLQDNLEADMAMLKNSIPF